VLAGQMVTLVSTVLLVGGPILGKKIDTVVSLIKYDLFQGQRHIITNRTSREVSSFFGQLRSNSVVRLSAHFGNRGAFGTIPKPDMSQHTLLEQYCVAESATGGGAIAQDQA
jgi:hypothetical protein